MNTVIMEANNLVRDPYFETMVAIYTRNLLAGLLLGEEQPLHSIRGRNGLEMPFLTNKRSAYWSQRNIR